MSPTTKPSDVIIRPESFYVAPHVLGLPLARPSRRLVALLLDLLIVTILVGLGGSFFFALALAFAFFRFAAKATKSSGNRIGAGWQRTFRVLGAVFLFIVVLKVIGSVRERAADDEPATTTETAGQVNATGSQAGRLAIATIALRNADSARAPAAAREAVNAARATGMDDEDVADMLEGIVASSPGSRWLLPAVAAATGVPRATAAAEAERPAPDSLALLYAAAARGGDEAAADTLGEALGGVLAAPQLAEARGEAAAARGEVAGLEADLEEEREKGILDTLLGLLDDLGISFGWTGLYFTAFTALWKGQTPAKRLLGIRVVRLSGQPMTLWMSFERFGGYAAGLVTGLLGFAQILWDKNRQGIHDKITETVVIRERVGLAPQPAPVGTPSAAAATPAPRPMPVGAAPPPGPPSA